MTGLKSGLRGASRLVVTNAEDGTLPLARGRLADAVRALVDPAPQWVDAVCRWQPALYGRLRTALTGQVREGRVAAVRVSGQRRAPCRIDARTLLVAIDRTTGKWVPDGKDTIERLHQLADRRWRLQDCDLIDSCSATIQQWAIKAAELLSDALRVHLSAPCPSCGAQWVYHRNSTGESVRQRALRVSELGCGCGACRAFWQPGRSPDSCARALRGALLARTSSLPRHTDTVELVAHGNAKKEAIAEGRCATGSG